MSMCNGRQDKVGIANGCQIYKVYAIFELPMQYGSCGESKPSLADARRTGKSQKPYIFAPYAGSGRCNLQIASNERGRGYWQALPHTASSIVHSKRGTAKS